MGVLFIMKIRGKLETINNGRGTGCTFRLIVPYDFGALTNLNNAKKVGFVVDGDKIIIVPMKELDDVDRYEYVRKVSYNCQPRFVIPKPLATEFLNLDKKSKYISMEYIDGVIYLYNTIEDDYIDDEYEEKEHKCIICGSSNANYTFNNKHICEECVDYIVRFRKAIKILKEI